jgi:hypothetical protein
VFVSVCVCWEGGLPFDSIDHLRTCVEAVDLSKLCGALIVCECVSVCWGERGTICFT